MENTLPTINPDLIERYMKAGDLKNLVSLFDFQRRQMARAEDLSRAYLAQMVVLEKRLGEARKTAVPATTTTTPTQPRQPKKKPSLEAAIVAEAVDLDL